MTEDWNPPVSAIRRALLDGNLTFGNHPTAGALLDSTKAWAHDAARCGRLFDVGQLEDGGTSDGSRAFNLFRDGHINHPFSDPYAIVIAWVSDKGRVSVGSTVLLVVPAVVDGPDTTRALLVMQFSPTRVNGQKMLGWTGHTTHALTPESSPGGTPVNVLAWSTDDHVRIAGTNTLAFTTMLLLATKGVAVERVPGSARLHLPPHYRVDGAAYTTALRTADRVVETHGGTHASPAPHVRRGHIRHLPNGTTTWVRDCLVNVVTGDEWFARSHYEAAAE